MLVILISQASDGNSWNVLAVHFDISSLIIFCWLVIKVRWWVAWASSFHPYYVYIHICMYIYILYIHIFYLIYSIHLYTYFIYRERFVYIYIYIHICMCIYTYTLCTYVYAYVYIYLYIYIYSLYAYIYCVYIESISSADDILCTAGGLFFRQRSSER